MSDAKEPPNLQPDNNQDTASPKLTSPDNPSLNNKVPSLFKLAAQWQLNNPQENIQNHIMENEVLQRINEITGLIRESYKDLSSQDGMMSKEPQEKLDWDLFCTVPVNIIEQYTKDMDDIFGKMERLSKVSITKQTNNTWLCSFLLIIT